VDPDRFALPQNRSVLRRRKSSPPDKSTHRRAFSSSIFAAFRHLAHRRGRQQLGFLVGATDFSLKNPLRRLIRRFFGEKFVAPLDSSFFRRKIQCAGLISR
jgi:hypothetical protein